MMHYPRKTPKQWIYEWEHDMKGDPDCMEELLQIDREKTATVNMMTESDEERTALEDRWMELLGRMGSQSYIKGHLTGYYIAAEQARDDLRLAQRAVKAYRFWGYGCILAAACMVLFL